MTKALVNRGFQGGMFASSILSLNISSMLFVKLCSLMLHLVSSRFIFFFLGGRKSSVAIPLTGAEASVARDGFSKAIYATLFEWLVYRINQTIQPKKDDPAKLKFIGLLGK